MPLFFYCFFTFFPTIVFNCCKCANKFSVLKMIFEKPLLAMQMVAIFAFLVASLIFCTEPNWQIQEKPKPLDLSNFAAHQKTLQMRRAKVKEICAKYKMKNRGRSKFTLRRNILCLPHFKICYCPNSKTGTTTWMHRILQLTNVPSELKKRWSQAVHGKMRAIYELPKTLSHFERREIVRNYTSFAFVRHPFVRLVSTFKDKIVDRRNYKNWRNLTNYQGKDEANVAATFRNFAYLIARQKMRKDSHLNSFWKKCDMCHIRFDIVGKMETFHMDTKFVYKAANVSLDYVEEEIHNKSSGDSSEDLARKLFANLPKHLIFQLYKSYKIDFDMFEYDYLTYYNLGMD